MTKFRYKGLKAFILIVTLVLFVPLGDVKTNAVPLVSAAEYSDRESQEEKELLEDYYAYQQRFDSIVTMRDITEQGYEIVEKHVFDIPLYAWKPLGKEGDLELQEATEVVRPEKIMTVDEKDALAVQEVPTLRFFTAIEKDCHRAAVFLADRERRIVYKTNQLECNYAVLGKLEQPIEDMISVAFQDLDGDNRMDIILIAGCTEQTSEGETRSYKIGEVLFQTGPALSEEPALLQEKEELENVSFYRDWRVNDKLNRFGMNKSAKCIRSFVRDGCSTEFLYTATTAEELLANGFRVIPEQSYWRNYEKLGNLKTLPGIFRIADYDLFLMYMINEQGDIVWSFHPMGSYDNLYSMRGMSVKDLDGDGMRDLLVLARYSREGENGELIVEGQYSVYYQRTGGFDEDLEYVASHPYREGETVEQLVKRIRAYWGWGEINLMMNKNDG